MNGGKHHYKVEFACLISDYLTQGEYFGILGAGNQLKFL